MTRIGLRIALAAAAMGLPVGASPQQPAVADAVYVLTGPRATALYHTESCPTVAGQRDVVTFTITDATARYFRPHCLCITGRDGPPPCEAPSLTASAPTAGPAKPLIGLTEEQLRSRLGQPSIVLSGVWHYDTKRGTLRVLFKNGRVSEWLPANFDMSAFGAAVPPPPSGGTTATPAAAAGTAAGRTVPKPSPAHPPGATAICKDGTYSYSSNRRGTCSGHGGVARWL